MQSSWRVFLVVGGAISATVGLTLDGVAGGRLQVIAATGQQAPNGIEQYLFFDEPALNDQGELAFRASLAALGGSGNGRSGIFRSDGLNAIAIVRSDQPGPGGSAAYGFFSFAIPAINEAGQVTFGAKLLLELGDVRGDEGILLGDGNTIGHVAVKGQQTPDRNGIFTNVAGDFANSFGYPINKAGNVGLSVGIGGAIPSNSNQRYYLGNEDELVEVARSGVPAPNGTGNIGSLRGLDINDSDQVAYVFAISGQRLESIFRFGAGNRDEIASTGQATTGGNGTFGDFYSMQLNDLGQVAFGVRINGGSGGTGLYISDGASPTQLVRSGTASPDGNGIINSFTSIELNNASQVAVRAMLIDTSGGDSDDLGLMIYDETGVMQVARERETTPSKRGTLNRLNAPFFQDFSLNDRGQVAFEATISGAPGSHEGIFLFDPVLGLHEVVRLDDPLLGSQIAEIDFVGGRNEFSGLNNRGQVAFAFTLNDGTEGVAVWTIPEPAGWQLLGLAMVAFAHHRRIFWA